MASNSLTRLTVLGAGVLGSQIAWHSAFKGKDVTLYDLFPETLGKVRAAHDSYADIYRTQLGAGAAEIDAARGRLTYSSDLGASVSGADLVIEAVPEVPETKVAVYREMASLLAPHTIVATNSSTLLPRDFAEATGRPDRYCAMHFANLIWAFNLVEIMAHPGTSPQTLTAATRFAIEIGQVPIAVGKEQNGYVLNSWLVPLLTAGIALVANGVATPEDVDRTYMITNRGCGMGPCGIVDAVGMKTAYDISAYWGEVRGDTQMQANAAYLKQRFLDRGLQGMMGGEGFYRYPDPAYAAPGFLAVPEVSAAPEIAARAILDRR